MRLVPCTNAYVYSVQDTAARCHYDVYRTDNLCIFTVYWVRTANLNIFVELEQILPLLLPHAPKSQSDDRFPQVTGVSG